LKNNICLVIEGVFLSKQKKWQNGLWKIIIIEIVFLK